MAGAPSHRRALLQKQAKPPRPPRPPFPPFPPYPPDGKPSNREMIDFLAAILGMPCSACRVATDVVHGL